MSEEDRQKQLQDLIKEKEELERLSKTAKDLGEYIRDMNEELTFLHEEATGKRGDVLKYDKKKKAVMDELYQMIKGTFEGPNPDDE